MTAPDPTTAAHLRDYGNGPHAELDRHLLEDHGHQVSGPGFCYTVHRALHGDDRGMRRRFPELFKDAPGCAEFAAGGHERRDPDCPACTEMDSDAPEWTI